MNTNKILSTIAVVCLAVLCLAGCARMGRPDGGWYDERPPQVLSSTPTDGGINVSAQKVKIVFDEYIKLENPSENVIISPPQIEQPEIKAQGKKIVVELKDTLKVNTTYTIDFGNAITDMSEGNVMELYTYKFSTGDRIDTLEVAGRVIDAETHEPVKGIYVGLHVADENFDDSVFVKEPLLRVARTDGSGRFRVCGVAPGTYKVFALQDADGDFRYGQKSEMLAFDDQLIVPSWKPDARQDTIWRDSLHIQAITRVPFTHFLPDDLVLRAFTAKMTDRMFVKSERKTPERFTLFYTYGNEHLPELRGLNFNDSNAFVIEPSLRKDTITYWLRDTALVNQDTLQIEMKYLMTDSMGVLVSQTDTLEILAKVSYEKRMKDKQKAFEKWQKEQEKKKKKDEPYDSVMAVDPLKAQITLQSPFTPQSEVVITLPEPLERFDTAAVHLTTKVDSVDVPVEFQLDKDSVLERRFKLIADWQLGTQYTLQVDSAAFTSIYGLVSDKQVSEIKLDTEEAFSQLMVNVSLPDVNAAEVPIIVNLMDKSNVLYTTTAESDGKAWFYYIKPGTYYMQCHVDRNANGEWDTGDYSLHLQPEEIYFYNKEIECKAKWDIKLEWAPLSVALDKQKPAELIKQKGDKKTNKKIGGRNEKKAREMGIELPEYLKRR